MSFPKVVYSVEKAITIYNKKKNTYFAFYNNDTYFPALLVCRLEEEPLDKTLCQFYSGLYDPTLKSYAWDSEQTINKAYRWLHEGFREYSICLQYSGIPE